MTSWLLHARFLFLQVETDVSVFEFNIHFIGGLLGAYSLSGDEVCVCVCVCVCGGYSGIQELQQHV